jgi:hypothetical protein
LLLDRVDDVSQILNEVEDCLSQLKMCPYERQAFLTVLSRIQSIVDELPSKGLANIAIWTSSKMYPW